MSGAHGVTRPVLPFVAQADADSTAAWVAALQRAMPQERVQPLAALSAEARRDCRVAIVANPHPDDLRTLPALHWVHSVWAGVERLMTDLADTRLHIVRLVDPQLAQTMAEAVLAWTLYLHRDMPTYARLQREARWQPLPAVRAQHRTVGLLGLGALGAAAAAALRQAGFPVLGWSRTPKALPGVHSHHGDDGLDALLAQADVLVCLLPLTPDTRGLLNAARLQRLRPGASLINFARGALVDDAALRDALDTGHLRHAVLDVFATEPLPASSWHWAHPAVTVLPHISAPTDRESASALVAAHVAQYRATGELPAGVDRQRGY
ncbi:2-hydroxyacid dehydrogenase [Roseateles sp. BYS87W]|uniref:2-hydroxyacid dehydrogenase n=1 Tax=Pelomonas baiyunensis TaxID=3299026 RepID=A0ABW7H3M6_9BURK